MPQLTSWMLAAGIDIIYNILLVHHITFDLHFTLCCRGTICDLQQRGNFLSNINCTGSNEAGHFSHIRIWAFVS